MMILRPRCSMQLLRSVEQQSDLQLIVVGDIDIRVNARVSNGIDIVDGLGAEKTSNNWADQYT